MGRNTVVLFGSLAMVLLLPVGNARAGCGDGADPGASPSGGGTASFVETFRLAEEKIDREVTERLQRENLDGRAYEENLKFLLQHLDPATANAWRWWNDREARKNLPLARIDWEKVERDLDTLDSIVGLGEGFAEDAAAGVAEAALEDGAERFVGWGGDTAKSQGATGLGRTIEGGLLVKDMAESMLAPQKLILLVPKMSAGNIAEGTKRVKAEVAARHKRTIARFNALMKKVAQDAWKKTGVPDEFDVPYEWGPEEYGALHLMYYQWKSGMRKVNAGPACADNMVTAGNGVSRSATTGAPGAQSVGPTTVATSGGSSVPGTGVASSATPAGTGRAGTIRGGARHAGMFTQP